MAVGLATEASSCSPSRPPQTRMQSLRRQLSSALRQQAGQALGGRGSGHAPPTVGGGGTDQARRVHSPAAAS